MLNILNKCPFCEGELKYASLYQYTKYYAIGKSGKVLSRCSKKEDNGPMEAFFITCVNEDFITDCEFTVTFPINSGIEINQKNGILYWERENEEE